IITDRSHIKKIETEEPNQCDVFLSDHISLDWKSLTRQFVSHSGCGICGANDVKKLAHTFDVHIDQTAQWLPLQQVMTLSSQLREQQSLFSATGGVHSAGIFTLNQCLSVHEDVGRHNAVDKVIGDLVNQDLLGTNNILMLSGRVSFELMQKAVAAKIAVVVAIGAPSSLAVSVAKQFNITLIGFVSEHTCNVYHGDFRLINSKHSNR
ncbi:MAG: formate dehydrogenase accessory sulfurtransferase FdhD, partial [Psychromonas sp.]